MSCDRVIWPKDVCVKYGVSVSMGVNKVLLETRQSELQNNQRLIIKIKL